MIIMAVFERIPAFILLAGVIFLPAATFAEQEHRAAPPADHTGLGAPTQSRARADFKIMIQQLIISPLTNNENFYDLKLVDLKELTQTSIIAKSDNQQPPTIDWASRAPGLGHASRPSAFAITFRATMAKNRLDAITQFLEAESKAVYDEERAGCDTAIYLKEFSSIGVGGQRFKTIKTYALTSQNYKTYADLMYDFTQNHSFYLQVCLLTEKGEIYKKAVYAASGRDLYSTPLFPCSWAPKSDVPASNRIMTSLSPGARYSSRPWPELGRDGGAILSGGMYDPENICHQIITNNAYFRVLMYLRGEEISMLRGVKLTINWVKKITCFE